MENCLISKEPIVHKITLPCQHSFDYYYLYQEVIEQKNRHVEYFKCPYCRAIYYSTLPYYEIEEVKKIIHVNYNNKLLLPLFPCSWKECTFFGNVYKNGHFCKKHYPLSMKKRCQATCLNGALCKNQSIPDTETCKRHSSNASSSTSSNASSSTSSEESSIPIHLSLSAIPIVNEIKT